MLPFGLQSPLLSLISMSSPAFPYLIVGATPLSLGNEPGESQGHPLCLSASEVLWPPGPHAGFQDQGHRLPPKFQEDLPKATFVQDV